MLMNWSISTEKKSATRRRNKISVHAINIATAVPDISPGHHRKESMDCRREVVLNQNVNCFVRNNGTMINRGASLQSTPRPASEHQQSVKIPV